MRSTLLMIIGGLSMTGLLACDSPTATDRGTFTLPAGAKADGSFTCANHCGSAEPTEDGCYCDKACSNFGDCCPDKAETCDTGGTPNPTCPDVCAAVCAGQPEPPLPAGCPTPTCDCGEPNPTCPDVCAAVCAGQPEPPLPAGCPTPMCDCNDPVVPPPSTCVSSGGEVFTRTNYVASTDGKHCAVTEEICLTKDASQCPQLSPMHPDWCNDGTIDTVPEYTIETLDGMYCKIPKVYCVTNDTSMCPQLSPYPPDWCSDGQKVSAGYSYLEIGNGKHCKIAQTRCLTGNAAACP